MSEVVATCVSNSNVSKIPLNWKISRCRQQSIWSIGAIDRNYVDESALKMSVAFSKIRIHVL